MFKLAQTERPGSVYSTMAFALPGLIGAKLAMPDRKVVAAVFDGAFLMNSKEIETALRESNPLVILIWEDGAYASSDGRWI